MAITLDDLKEYHIYKFENTSPISMPSGNNSINFYHYWGVETNISPVSQTGYTVNNVIGRTIYRANQNAILHGYSSFMMSDFVGSFYFIYYKYVGDVSQLLPYITKVEDYYVTDRTAGDVAYAIEEMKRRAREKDMSLTELKGCFNACDFNRINANIMIVKDNLALLGYEATVSSVVVNKQRTEYLLKSHITTIISNITALKDAFYEPLGWLTFPDNLSTYEDANIIEKNLYLLYEAVDKLLHNRPKSGTFYSGARRLLPLGS